MKSRNKVDASPSREREAQEQSEKRLLSDRDRDAFLALLDSDEEPNEALGTARVITCDGRDRCFARTSNSFDDSRYSLLRCRSEALQ